MVDQPSPPPQAGQQLRTRLQELSRLLHGSDNLTSEAREQLADLVAELGEALQAGQVEPTTLTHLTNSAGQIAEGLRSRRKGLLAAARDGLERVVVQAEGEAPVATGFAERLIDILSNIGI